MPRTVSLVLKAVQIHIPHGFVHHGVANTSMLVVSGFWFHANSSLFASMGQDCATFILTICWCRYQCSSTQNHCLIYVLRTQPESTKHRSRALPFHMGAWTAVQETSSPPLLCDSEQVPLVVCYALMSCETTPGAKRGLGHKFLSIYSEQQVVMWRMKAARDLELELERRKSRA